MKIFTLLSMSVVTLACVENVQAQFEVRESLATCLSKATGEAATVRCHGIQDCVENRSTTDDDFRLCLGDVEAAYQEATGGGIMSQVEPEDLTATGVNTDMSNSNYNTIEGNKGYKNAP